MADYTFITSRDPVEGDHLVHELASGLATGGHDVTLFLVENGTFLARNGVCDGLLAQVCGAGVSVLADEFSLAERGISGATLSDGVSPSPLDTVVDHLAAGRKVSWH